MPSWLEARHEQELKEILLRDERFLSLKLDRQGQASALVGKPLKDVAMPEGTLIALIRRRGQIVVPRGSTVLEDGDRLTIVGGAREIRELTERYG